jgi:hypothetical protein
VQRFASMLSWRTTGRWLALCAQAVLLARIAGLEAGSSLALVGAACGLAFALRSPPLLDALAFGGLGMTLGWWVDLGLPWRVAGVADVPPAAWCGSAPGFTGAASWMNAGMLAGAAVAARFAACSRPRFVAECVGMLLGMHLAARAVALSPNLALIAPHAAMCAGMLAGMQISRVESLRIALGRSLLARLPNARPRRASSA